jgi:hypothetical protein
VWGGINPKLTPEHRRRGAVVCSGQSTLGRVMHNTESQAWKMGEPANLSQYRRRSMNWETAVSLIGHSCQRITDRVTVISPDG